MYTRCPSCRSEITFEPPANMDSLPEGYKHRITCPCCGVTIGVKLNKPTTEVQPTFTPQNPYATSGEPVYNAGEAEGFNPNSLAEKKKAKDAEIQANGKKSGRSRNFFILLFSLLLVAVNVLSYLKVAIPFTDGFDVFNGIGVFENIITNFETFKVNFTADIVSGIFYLIPALLFVLAGISAIVAFIAFIGKKYSRAFNFIWSLLILAAAVVELFIPVIQGSEIVEYFVNLVMGDAPKYGEIIVVGIAFLQLVFALIFCKPMKKKEKKAKK